MNPRFSIYDGRMSFYQWDVNQRIVVPDDAVKPVHQPLAELVGLYVKEI